ncbi:MAG: mannitol-1-phosphate 5-dehydrogenase [Treponema sp.]|jgi:mannitol-1-phosphate 5-dehydrogenase|nr:mannitol-1-phosphate 5-dehydrogenase [Treponema sp.]
MKALMYGAGNIGRGFVGQAFAFSGYGVTFIDIADPVVNALNRDRRYPVRILSGSVYEDNWVEGVRAVNGRDAEKVSMEIAAADIMATAVGARVLPVIAPVIAAGIKQRFTQTSAPLDIIICENLIDANKLLEELIMKNLNSGEIELFRKRVGLVEASIGRMVPIQTPEMQDGNPLRVCTEAYNFLPVDKEAFKGEIPKIANMVPCGRFDFYIKRKLFIHNMGHAVCAYLGMLKGDKFIYETALQDDILFIVQNAMMESALALSSKFGVPLADLHFHIRDLLFRFSNKALADTCARVGADTSRKLGPRDRLIGAIGCCREEKVTPAFISAGTAAALYCHLKEKGAKLSMESAAMALENLSGLSSASPDAALILSMYDLIAGNTDLPAIILAATEAGARKGVV